jgi:mono/diheme cytochrome c family protein
MSEPRKRGRALRKALLLCAIALIFLAIGLAAFHKTPWAVPEAEKARKNPLTASNANISAAKQIYTEQCANCHGDTGKGDGSDAMMYDPSPADLTDAAKMSKKTDGEIYYQITEGRKPMPSFRRKLTEDQRWQLVILVRSFAGAPAAPPPSKLPEVSGEKQPEPPAKKN